MKTCTKDELALSNIHWSIELRNWAQNIISFDEIENLTSFPAIKRRYSFAYLGVILLPNQTMYLSDTCVFEIAVKKIDLWSLSSMKTIHDI